MPFIIYQNLLKLFYGKIKNHQKHITNVLSSLHQKRGFEAVFKPYKDGFNGFYCYAANGKKQN